MDGIGVLGRITMDGTLWASLGTQSGKEEIQRDAGSATLLELARRYKVGTSTIRRATRPAA
jgi:hypothetical protein